MAAKRANIRQYFNHYLCHVCNMSIVNLFSKILQLGRLMHKNITFKTRPAAFSKILIFHLVKAFIFL